MTSNEKNQLLKASLESISQEAGYLHGQLEGYDFKDGSQDLTQGLASIAALQGRLNKVLDLLVSP